MLALLGQEYVFIPLIVVGIALSGVIWKKLGGSLNPVGLFHSSPKPGPKSDNKEV